MACALLDTLYRQFDEMAATGILLSTGHVYYRRPVAFYLQILVFQFYFLLAVHPCMQRLVSAIAGRVLLPGVLGEAQGAGDEAEQGSCAASVCADVHGAKLIRLG